MLYDCEMHQRFLFRTALRAYDRQTQVVLVHRTVPVVCYCTVHDKES